MTTPSTTRRGFLSRAAALSGSAALAQPPAAAPLKLLCAPVLTNPAPDAVTVIWATNGAATGWVEFGESDKLGQVARGGHQGLRPFDERNFKIRVEGLKPGTKYYYRVRADRTRYDWHKGILRDGQAESAVHCFTTPNPAAAEAKFTIWNDTHENVETVQRLHAAHEQTPGDFMLWNGDLTNDFYADEKMVDQLLNPAGLPFAATVPFHFVRGNHDVRGPYARRLSRYTDVPDGKHYYSFRQGPLAALVLDTGEDKPDDSPVYGGLGEFAAFRTMQIDWLAKAIEHPEFRSAPFRVLFCHIPLWWIRERELGTYCLDGQKKWHALIEKAGIRLVISGHTHEAAWIPPNARHRYGQLIGGGPKPAHATYISGHVTREKLRFTQHKLDGRVLHDVEMDAKG